MMSAWERIAADLCQSNGMAERTVKTVKSLLENAQDPHMALMSYRSTPLSWCNLSPAELLMGHKIRTDVPQITKLFIQDWPHIANFQELNEKYQAKQKHQFDQCRRAKELSALPADTPVWVSTGDRQVPGTICR